jgi:hypothetical protein
MRTPWLVALATVWLLAGEAHAQAYQYVARTVAPATRTGAVTAGSLTWQCTGSECRISGPWPAPGVPACAALATQVGRIASYGRSGAMLSAEQLTQCNANLPAAPIIQLNPRVAAHVRPQSPVQAPPIVQLPSSAVVATPPAATPSEVAIEPGTRPQDMRLHVLSSAGIRFHGVSAPLPRPALPPDVVRIVSGRIDTPGIRLHASAPGATPTARSAATSETPFYRLGTTGAVTLRVPVSLRDLPSDAIGLHMSCVLSALRNVPSPRTSPFRDLHADGAGAHSRMVARGEGETFIRNIGRYETTFDIPMQLRPFYRLEDARSYACAVQMLVDRVSEPGVERLAIDVLADPTRPASRAPYHPAAGTTPLLLVRGNIQ